MDGETQPPCQRDAGGQGLVRAAGPRESPKRSRARPPAVQESNMALSLQGQAGWWETVHTSSLLRRKRQRGVLGETP